MCGFRRMATDPPNGSTEQNLQVILASVSPILTQLPKWVEHGVYLEFGDDEVRFCEGCHDVCEWVYFKLSHYNGCGGLELCGSCLEKYKKPTSWIPCVREGLLYFLGSLSNTSGLPPSVKSVAGLELKPSNTLHIPTSAVLPSPSKSGSPAHSFEQSSPSGQLLDPCNFEPAPHSRPLLSASSEPLNVARACESTLLKSNSEPMIFSANPEQGLFTPSSESILFPSNADPVPFSPKTEGVSFQLDTDAAYFEPGTEPLHFPPDTESTLFPPNHEPVHFSSHSDPTLLTSNTEPVLFTSNAEPVHFLSHSKPAMFTPITEPALFSPYRESLPFSESLGLIPPKSEPIQGASPSESGSFTSNLEALPDRLSGLNNNKHLESGSLFSSNSGTMPTTPSSELSQSSSAEPNFPSSEPLVRTQSKSGKKVSDGTLVDRMRTIVQQDCRLGKDLFTTGIELAERYNSCYRNETIHVRRVFEAMKTLGYAASKDTMQVQVQKVRRKVKLIYGLAMK